METNSELDHIITNAQRVLELTTQYENYPYIEEFIKGCNIVFIYKTYKIEGEAYVNFSLSKMQNLLQDVVDTSNCMTSLMYLETTSQVFP